MSQVLSQEICNLSHILPKTLLGRVLQMKKLKSERLTNWLMATHYPRREPSFSLAWTHPQFPLRLCPLLLAGWPIYKCSFLHVSVHIASSAYVPKARVCVY